MKQAVRIFGKLEDIRQPRKVQHNLVDIVLMTLIGVMCNCTDWVEIAAFCRAREKHFKEYLELPNGIPSHDTFQRVMGLVDPDHYAKCYQQWVATIIPSKGADYVSIDGKAVRGSGEKRRGQKPLHMVSAWSTRYGITLAQLKTMEKSNEITAVPELLDMLQIAGCVVTIDAMGCQTKIAEKILQRGGDYVLAVKENQELLHREIQEYFTGAERDSYLEVPHYTAESLEKNHGRLEHRKCVQISECALLTRFHDFAGAQSIVQIKSQTVRNGEMVHDTRYFISSLQGSDRNAQRIADAVRAHWGIENRCHWALDVTFNEDACRTRDLIAAQNLTIVRKLALALSKRVPDEIVEKYSHGQAKYTSMKKRLFLANLYPDFMMEILLTGL